MNNVKRFQVLEDRIENLENDLAYLKDKVNSITDKNSFSHNKKEVTYRIGNKFIDVEQTLFLAQVGPGYCCLIDMENGNRVRDKIKVNDIHKITTEELLKMGYSEEPIELVESSER